MRPILIFLSLLLALGAGLYAFGVFDTDDPGVGPGDAGGGENGGPGGTLGIGESSDGAPGTMPEAMALRAPTDTRVLIVSATPTTHTASLSEVVGRIDGGAYTMWFKNGMGQAEFSAAKGLPALSAAPTGDDLSTNDISVVILDNIDPSWLPDDFYTTLKQRVTDGLTGLFVQAYVPFALGEGPQKAYAAFDHPVLSVLLPVGGMKSLDDLEAPNGGRRSPGIVSDLAGAPFVLTDAGGSHPAVQLSQYERWHQAHWAEAGRGDAALRTKFVCPVEDVATDAQVLLEVAREGGEAWPALVASKRSEGRVLWFGCRELGWEAHWDRAAKNRMYAAVTSMIAWLAGAVPPLAPGG